MKRFNFCILAILIFSLVSCTSGDEKFLDWKIKNEGKQFSAEKMQELVSLFGPAVDTSNGGEEVLEGFKNAFFLGPAFSTEEGKILYNEALAETTAFNNYWNEYMNKTGNEQGLGESSFSSNNSHWSEYLSALDTIEEKHEKLYNEKSNNKQFTLAEFLSAYQKKFPNLSKDQCIEDIKNFHFRRITDYELNNLQNTTYTFMVEKSTSYKRFMGKQKTNIVDFKVKVFNDVIVSKEGKILPSSGSSYKITEDSKKDLEKRIVGVDWVYKSGGKIIAAIKYSKDGTYRYTTSMFGGISKQGNWYINNDGGIDATNQDQEVKIVNSGIQFGETVYVKN